MDIVQAKKAITAFFKKHKAPMATTLPKSTGGKIYELYCLAMTLEWLRSTYGAHIQLVGPTEVSFKASPGNIDRKKSYFVVRKGPRVLELHTDIQVRTLGASHLTGHVDLSGYHEIDLVLIDPAVPDGAMPRHDQLVLGVECKSHAKFEKGIVKQVLGIRRELSMLSYPHPSRLDSTFGHARYGGPPVRANPASLYWLAYVDPKGNSYSSSPGFFGIEFKHWAP